MSGGDGLNNEEEDGLEAVRDADKEEKDGEDDSDEEKKEYFDKPDKTGEKDYNKDANETEREPERAEEAKDAKPGKKKNHIKSKQMVYYYRGTPPKPRLARFPKTSPRQLDPSVSFRRLRQEKLACLLPPPPEFLRHLVTSILEDTPRLPDHDHRWEKTGVLLRLRIWVRSTPGGNFSNFVNLFPHCNRN